MYVPFETMPDNARIWIYQNHRFLTNDEVDQIAIKSIEFIESWTAHNHGLQASFKIVHQLFFVLAVNEEVTMASGCSIDKSVQFIKQLEAGFKLDFFNRMQVAINWQNEIQLLPLQQLKTVSGNTFLYDNLITTLGEFRNDWVKPISVSWAKQFV